MVRQKSVVLGLLLAVTVLAACQGKGDGTSVTVKPITQIQAKASVSPEPVPTASSVVRPSASASADKAATSPLAASSPLLYRPSEEPTVTPSGHAVSPLPLDAFPPDPSPTASAVTASAVPTAPPTPAPTPTPGQPATMTIISNTLDYGSGSVGGVVIGPDPSGTGEAPVAGGTVTIVEVSDTTKRCVIKVGADGQYRIGTLALTDYYVTVSESGYSADTAPTEVSLSIGSNQNSNTPLVLVKTVALPT